MCMCTPAACSPRQQQLSSGSRESTLVNLEIWLLCSYAKSHKSKTKRGRGTVRFIFLHYTTGCTTPSADPTCPTETPTAASVALHPNPNPARPGHCDTAQQSTPACLGGNPEEVRLCHGPFQIHCLHWWVLSSNPAVRALFKRRSRSHGEAATLERGFAAGSECLLLPLPRRLTCVLWQGSQQPTSGSRENLLIRWV